MSNKRKFSIVGYLNGEDKNSIRELQQALTHLTGSRACLDSWDPHVTLGDGVELDKDELHLLEKKLVDFTKNQTSCTVQLSGFGGLPDRVGGKNEVTTSYVLWIDVVVNENLKCVVEEVEKSITSKFELWYKMPRPYTPHVTVAFRDLSEEGYKTGQVYLAEQKYDRNVKIDHIALVEKFPEQDIEYTRFNFLKSNL